MGSVPSWRVIPPPADDPYWQLVRGEASRLSADGCTGVPDFYLDACLEHDIHYMTHEWLDETPIFRSEADARFRDVIRSRSPLGVLSPMALWRWTGVRLLGKRHWDN